MEYKKNSWEITVPATNNYSIMVSTKGLTDQIIDFHEGRGEYVNNCFYFCLHMDLDEAE